MDGKSAIGRPRLRAQTWWWSGRSYTSHRRTIPMEPRSAMAYWQNSRCYLHCSTQSVARTQRAHAQRLGIDESDLALISPWTGGGFGSKIQGSVTDVIPAVLARETGRPVMLRVTRDEETYFGRARSGLQGWAKMGFQSDGRLTALDLLLVQDSGSYGRMGRLQLCGLDRIVGLSAGGHAVSGDPGDHKHASSRSPAGARGCSGHHDAHAGHR